MRGMTTARSRYWPSRKYAKKPLGTGGVRHDPNRPIVTDTDYVYSPNIVNVMTVWAFNQKDFTRQELALALKMESAARQRSKTYLAIDPLGSLDSNVDYASLRLIRRWRSRGVLHKAIRVRAWTYTLRPTKTK